MPKQNIIEKLIEIKNFVFQLQKNKPIFFHTAITIVIMLLAIAVLVFAATYRDRSNFIKHNERAEALKVEMMQILNSNIEDLKKEQKNLEEQLKLSELEQAKESNEKLQLIANGKNIDKSERAKFEELKLMKDNNDLKGYSDELIKNLGY